MNEKNQERLDELNPTTDELRMEEVELGKMAFIDEKMDETLEEDVTDTENAEGDFDQMDSMKLYLAEIAKAPLLTAEEELQLGETIKEGGDQALQARNILVSSNMRLVVYYAKRYLGSGVDINELISAGSEGLIRAAEKFDYTMGFRFSTYASWWIKQAITRGIANSGCMVRIPVYMNEAIQRIRNAQKYLSQELGKEPTDGEIADYLSIDEKKVEDTLGVMYNIISIDTKIGEDGDTTLGDFIADDKTNACYEEVEQSDLNRALQIVLNQLEPKEQTVLRLRFGIGGQESMTLEEIANLPEFGVSRERIRQIESKALRKIRRNPKYIELLSGFVA